MSTKFNMTRDINGYNGFGVDFADDSWQTTLAANVEQELTVPSNYQNWIAVFSFTPGNDVWVARNATANSPGGSFSADPSELNPVARRVKGGDVLHFISESTTNPYVNVLFYVIDPYTN